jgi:hypothetical protein
MDFSINRLGDGLVISDRDKWFYKICIKNILFFFTKTLSQNKQGLTGFNKQRFKSWWLFYDALRYEKSGAGERLSTGRLD